MSRGGRRRDVMTAVAHSRQACDFASSRIGGYDPRLLPQEESTITVMEGCSGAGLASGAGLMLQVPACGGCGCTYSTPGSREGYWGQLRMATLEPQRVATVPHATTLVCLRLDGRKKPAFRVERGLGLGSVGCGEWIVPD